MGPADVVAVSGRESLLDAARSRKPSHVLGQGKAAAEK
jgi:hypothetical protein